MAALGAFWLVATILLAGLYPGLLQRYAVEPNEIVRESPYITHNIRFTRLAFGLDKLETRPFDNIDDLQQQDLDDNAGILKNIRLWDYRPLQATYEQLQALRPYYQFGEVDIDRYVINGETRQVMLATRELNRANLPADFLGSLKIKSDTNPAQYRRYVLNSWEDTDTADVTAENATITVEKYANPTSGAPSTNITFTIYVNNTGDVELNPVNVTDLLPAGLDYIATGTTPTPDAVINMPRRPGWDHRQSWSEPGSSRHSLCIL